jgi:hypothetical protein
VNEFIPLFHPSNQTGGEINLSLTLNPLLTLNYTVGGVNVNLWHSGGAAFGTGTGHVFNAIS